MMESPTTARYILSEMYNAPCSNPRLFLAHYVEFGPLTQDESEETTYVRDKFPHMPIQVRRHAEPVSYINRLFLHLVRVCRNKVAPVPYPAHFAWLPEFRARVECARNTMLAQGPSDALRDECAKLIGLIMMKVDDRVWHIINCFILCILDSLMYPVYAIDYALLFWRTARTRSYCVKGLEWGRAEKETWIHLKDKLYSFGMPESEHLHLLISVVCVASALLHGDPTIPLDSDIIEILEKKKRI